jgi:hypothetical protein
VPIAADLHLTAMAVEPDGVAAVLLSSPAGHPSVVGITNCALDTAFGHAGVANPLPASQGIKDASLLGLTVEPNGDIVLAGSDSRGFLVIRLLSTGAIDTSFGTGGAVTVPEPAPKSSCPIGKGGADGVTFDARAPGHIVVIGQNGACHAGVTSVMIELNEKGAQVRRAVQKGLFPGAEIDVITSTASGEVIAAGTSVFTGCGGYSLAAFHPALARLAGFRPPTMPPKVAGETTLFAGQVLPEESGFFVASDAMDSCGNVLGITDRAVLARYLADGHLERSYGSGGVAAVSGDLGSATAEPGGVTILTSTSPAAGRGSKRPGRCTLRAFNASGKPDRAFGTAGVESCGPTVAPSLFVVDSLAAPAVVPPMVRPGVLVVARTTAGLGVSEHQV